MLSLVTILHFIFTQIKTYILLNPYSQRHSHVLALATQKWLCLAPVSFVEVPDGFCALQFVPSAMEVLAEKKLFYVAFCPFFPRFLAFIQCQLKI